MPSATPEANQKLFGKKKKNIGKPLEICAISKEMSTPS
jgi:hypothetical protein